MSSSSTSTVPSTAKKLEPFVCGGTAAITASCVVHPIDLVKVRIQLFRTVNSAGTVIPSPISMMRTMIAEEGFTSIYSGLSAAIARQASYGTARIGLHRSFSDALMKRNEGQPLPFFTKAASGMLSGSLAVCIGTPMDVALVRMQADSMKPVEQRRNYSNVLTALLRIAREEGVAALYSGLAPNILRGMSMNMGMMACYDEAKELIAKHVTYDPDPAKPQMNTQLGASLVAGFCAAFFSLPFDLIKSRLQDGTKYKGIIDCAGQLLQKEGFFAFWTGFSAYYGRCAPHAMIILLSIEGITKQYRRTFE